MKKKHIFLIISTIISMVTFSHLHNSITLGDVSVYELGNVLISSDDTKNSDSTHIGQPIDLTDINSLKKSFYAIDKKTGMPSDLFNLTEFSQANLHINTEGNGPKVLIFHTHGSEMYADSKNTNEGVIGVGEYLKSILEDKYGIECLHITDKFDIVEGKLQRDGAYERAEPVITQIIKENPSIQLVIDLHRDGVNENLRLATEINGKSYAKIMFFNGICRKWENGNLVPTEGLENPYLKTNLALSFQMQYAVTQFNSNITRKIYINAYRYSLHMKDKSMLIELGAQTNTYEEALNSIEVVADALGKVCF
ncbi:MAG: stage II sporulation protein P [Clostridia bacterium]|nr:stage II sporulation protein P [Clostridia bacterium]